MKDFSGRVAAITGAGSGIGRALAYALARSGAHLALSDIDDAGLAETVAQCEGFGVKVTSQHLDVAERDAVYAWADHVVADHGRVNLIFNNAGVALGATVESMSYEDFEWLMNINFWGVVYGTKAFLPASEALRRGPHRERLQRLRSDQRAFPVGLQRGEVRGAGGSPTHCAWSWRSKAPPSRSRRSIPGASRRTSHATHEWMRASGTSERRPDKAVREFERAFITSPEKAAAQILTAVRRDRRRRSDRSRRQSDRFRLTRSPPCIYQSLLTRGAASRLH